MFGIIYLIVPSRVYLTPKVMLLAKYFIYYMTIRVKAIYGLLKNISEDGSECSSLRTRVSNNVINSISAV